MIHFEMVTPDNLNEVINLRLKEEQVGFLENNLYSLAESKVFDYLEARAIYNGATLIGFMLYHRTAKKTPASSGSGMNLSGMKKT